MSDSSTDSHMARSASSRELDFPEICPEELDQNREKRLAYDDSLVSSNHSTPAHNVPQGTPVHVTAPSTNGPLGGVRKVISVPKCVSQTSEVPPCATAPTATNLNQQNRNIVKRPRAIIPKPKQNTAPPLTPTHSEEPDAHKIADRRTQPNKSKYITLQGNLLNLKVFKSKVLTWKLLAT